MYGLSGFEENLNIPYCVNVAGNCIHYMYGFFGLTENRNSANMLNVWNWINLSGNYVDYMYELSGFEEKLNIHNCVNSSRNCVQQM